MTIANTTDFRFAEGAEKAGREESIFAGFFKAMVESRTRHARSEILRVLQGCSDSQLQTIGYDAGEIADIRSGRLVILS